MNLFKCTAVAAALFMAVLQPAAAQWQTPNHSVPMGRGVGVTGFGNAAPGSAGQPLVSNGPNADPSFQSLSANGNVFATVVALRANTAAITTAQLLGYTLVADGGEGTLNYVASDVASADNNCTIFVDASGHRFYRTAAYGSVNVKWCGAKGDGATNDVVPINRAVKIVCDGNATIASPTPFVNGTAFFPPGNYIVDGGINVDNFSGGHVSAGCTLQGSGETATVLLTLTGATANMLEIVGSSSIIIRDMYLRASAGTSVVNVIGIASSNTNPCNVIRLENVFMDSFVNVNSLLAIQNCTEGLVINVGGAIFPPATSSHNLISITSTNPFGWNGAYATISPVTPAQSGGWNFFQTQIHDQTHNSGSSTVIPFLVQGGNAPINWFGGIIAGSVAGGTGGSVTLASGSGAVTGLSFNGTNFYGDNGTQSDYTIYPNASATGVSLRNCAILNNLGVFAAVSGLTYKGLEFSSNTNFGAIFAPPAGNNGTVISAHIDAQGAAINLGAAGSITHSVLLNPGAVTAATQTNIGSF